MKTIEKILTLRKSNLRKIRDPDNVFNRKIGRARKLLQTVEKLVRSKKIIYEARRQFIVSLATGFEIYWRELIRITVDSHNHRSLNLSKLKDINFKITDMMQILERKISLGELISCSYSFQSSDTVNKAISDLLETDFFSSLSKSDIRLQPVGKQYQKSGNSSKNLVTEVFKGKEYIEKCFAIRHETVHNLAHKINPTKKFIERLNSNIWLFNLVVGYYFVKSYSEKCKARK